MRRKWIFGEYDKDKVAALAQECAVSPFTALLLSVRGIDTPAAVQDFLDTDSFLSDPFLM